MAGYDAITFDTQTVMSNGFAFNSGLLQSLKSLKGMPIKVIITDVVKSEIIKHTAKLYHDLIHQKNESNRKNHDHGLIDSLPEKTLLPKDAQKIAIDKFDDYLLSLGCITLDISSVSIIDLMNRYYKSIPPFSRSGDKKYEFPDAISLLTLQNYAIDNNYRILAISGDKDWHNFAENTSHLDVVTDVSGGLDLINKHREDAYFILSAIMRPAFEGTSEEIYNKMDVLLHDAVAAEFPFVNADSSFNYDAHDLSLHYNSFHFSDEDFKILEISSDLKSFKIEVDANIYYTATAIFSFSVMDYDGDDHYVINDSEYDSEINSNVKLLMAISIVNGSTEIDSLDITKFPSVIHFGYVEPDFR